MTIPLTSNDGFNPARSICVRACSRARGSAKSLPWPTTLRSFCPIIRVGAEEEAEEEEEEWPWVVREKVEGPAWLELGPVTVDGPVGVLAVDAAGVFNAELGG